MIPCYYPCSAQCSLVCYGCDDVFLEATDRILALHTALCPLAIAVLEADEAALLREGEDEEGGAGGMVWAGPLEGTVQEGDDEEPDDEEQGDV